MQLRDDILDFSPYSPGLSIDEIKEKYNLTNVIKMASNENPLGISPIVEEVLKKYASFGFRYPRSGNLELVKKIFKKFHIPEKNIVIGNGSDEIIDILIRIICTSYRDNVVVFDPSFSIYRIQAKFHGIEVKFVPLNNDFSFNFEQMLELIDSHTKMIFITNPDNPSGYTVLSEEIINFVDLVPSSVIVIVDEAYVEFCDDPEQVTCIKEVLKRDNLCVLRTFSKIYGLAGLRVGYGILPELLADYFYRVRLPFSVNILAERAAISVLDDENYVELTRNTIICGRRYLTDRLTSLGCYVYPSQANFIMFKPPMDANKVFEGLLKQGVIIRPLKSYGLKDYLRVSIGREDENRIFISALKKVLREE